MQVQEIIGEFEQKIASILVEERLELSLTRDFFERFAKSEEMRKAYPDVPFGSHYLMAYRSADDEYPVFFAKKKFSPQEIAQLHADKKARKYSWLFVDAYEAFEDFLELIHAHLGVINPNNWHLSDFGKIRINDLSEKGFDWHQEQARKKKDAPDSMLTNLRGLDPEFAVKEINNKSGVNFRHYFCLCQRIRHIIVHNRGSVSELDDFIKVVFKASGIAHDEALDELSRHFFVKKNDHYHVSLIERVGYDGLPFSYHDVLEWAITTILAHAHLVAGSVRKIASNT